jgi:hypothetical protein
VLAEMGYMGSTQPALSLYYAFAIHDQVMSRSLNLRHARHSRGAFWSEFPNTVHLAGQPVISSPDPTQREAAIEFLLKTQEEFVSLPEAKATANAYQLAEHRTDEVRGHLDRLRLAQFHILCTKSHAYLLKKQFRDITLTPGPSPSGRGAGGEGRLPQCCQHFGQFIFWRPRPAGKLYCPDHLHQFLGQLAQVVNPCHQFWPDAFKNGRRTKDQGRRRHFVFRLAMRCGWPGPARR